MTPRLKGAGSTRRLHPRPCRARWTTRSSSCAGDASPASRSSWSLSRRQYGGAALRRVEQAVRIHLHLEAPVFPDPRQKPTFLFFPGLPATPYLDKGLIPEIEDLEAATSEIRAELQGAAAGRRRPRTRVPYRRARTGESARPRRAAELERLLLLSSRRAARRQLRGLSNHGSGARCAAARARARPWPRGVVFGFLSRHAFAAALWCDEHARRGTPAAHDPRGLRAARGRRGSSLARRRGRGVRRHLRTRSLESQRSARAS